jgi:hypothetical protein
MTGRPRRVRLVCSDADILDRPDDVEVFRAVAAGRVHRGPEGHSRARLAAHYADSDPIQLQLRRLTKEDLIELPISGPPSLTPRGRRVLSIANGEIAPPPPD